MTPARSLALPVLGLALALAAPPAHADRGSHGRFFAVEPAVYPRRATCTTEPPPATPVLKARPSPRARLVVRVTGAGWLCRARWTAARASLGSTDVTLSADGDADAPSACGTCSLELLVTRLGRGDYRLTFAGATLRAHAP